MIQPTETQIDRLKNLNSTYRFTHSGQQNKPGEPRRFADDLEANNKLPLMDRKPPALPVVKCEILHNVTLEPYAWSGENDKLKALERAIQQAEAGPSPMISEGSLVNENRRLKSELKDLREREGRTDWNLDNERVGDLNALSAAELVEEFQRRGMNPPGGDRRSKQWKSLAVEILERKQESTADLATASAT